MKFIIKLVRYLVRSLVPIGAVGAVAIAAAGPIPFTQNQFPVWWATQSTQQQAISNANEIVLFQTAVPPYIMGNNGSMNFTLFVGSTDAAAGTVTHAIKCYLGGTNAALGAVWGAVGLTPGTPVFTNTFTTTVSQPIQAFMLAAGSATTNYVWGSTTTNSFVAGDTRRQVTYGMQTNGILLTITGSAGGTGGSTNIVNLDGVIIQALNVQ